MIAAEKTIGCPCPHCKEEEWIPKYAVSNLCKDSCEPHYFVACAKCGKFAKIAMSKDDEGIHVRLRD